MLHPQRKALAGGMTGSIDARGGPSGSLLRLRHQLGQRCRQVLRQKTQILERFLAEWELTHVGWFVHSVTLNSLHMGPCSPRHVPDQHGSPDQSQSNAGADSHHELLPAGLTFHVSPPKMPSVTPAMHSRTKCTFWLLPCFVNICLA